MISLAFVLLAQLATFSPVHRVAPVLSFPETGLDDSAAYAGYRTRFYRDAASNTVQIYLDAREGRVVHLLADAEDESVGWTVRDGSGRPATVRWGGADAIAGRVGARRSLEYALLADATQLHLGQFQLGSMRVERDFQYEGRHRLPFASPAYHMPEFERLLTALGSLDPATRRRHLSILGASDVDALRRRLEPKLAITRGTSRWVAQVTQPSLDGRDTLTLEVMVDPRRVAATQEGDSISLRATDGATVPFSVRITTTARALTPLSRGEIFTPEFLAYLDRTRTDATVDRTRARRLERQVRAVELLASREKLMAGLPNYATYFGRDMLVTALMMRPIWHDDVSAFVVASVLRKLGPNGEVSHEEALGGQAVREAASEYAALVAAQRRAVDGGDRRAADTLLARATRVLSERRRVRENYHMIDDELQLPVLAARWLADPRVPAARKRAFLLDSTDGGGTRLARLLAELGLVARMTAAYAADPVAANLISFPPRDSAGWSSASWRDSGVGYAGGRFAMDVNALWAPHALESLGRIVTTIRELGLWTDALTRSVPALAADAPLGRWTRDPAALQRATDTWRGAARHFVVHLDAGDVRSRAAARVAAMPAGDRAAWALDGTPTAGDSLTFLAIALDASGRPIGVASTDPATGLFLGESERGASPPLAAERARVLRDVRLFVRAYPEGLFVDRVGPVVSNDAYATPAVWQAFERDAYHGPRVVWGREVNLFLLGVASHIAAAGDTTADPALAAYVRELSAASTRVRAAVEASGFHSELWSYAMQGGRPVAVRYGTGSDLQLWSTTDLAVEYALSRLRR